MPNHQHFNVCLFQLLVVQQLLLPAAISAASVQPMLQMPTTLLPVLLL